MTAPRLSEGAVVEASVVGRVLGLRVLRLEATVVIAPPSRPPLLSGQPSTNGRRSLAEASACLHESARGLEALRQTSRR